MTPLAILDEVRRAIGEAEFRAYETRWQEAVAEDPQAVRNALRDLQRARGHIRSRAGWLWRAFRAQRDEHLKYAHGRAA